MKRLQIPQKLVYRKFYFHEIAVVNLSNVYLLKNAKKTCKPNNRDWVIKTVCTIGKSFNFFFLPFLWGTKWQLANIDMLLIKHFPVCLLPTSEPSFSFKTFWQISFVWQYSIFFIKIGHRIWLDHLQIIFLLTLTH